jgi:RHS repeat-associated protein
MTRLIPLVSVAVALALGSAELSPAQAAPRSAKSLRQVLNALPQQRVGSAAGLGHESGTGGNNVIPPSSRSRYPLLDFSAEPTLPSNRARVVRVGRAEQGYQPASSHEVVEKRSRFERSFTNLDGTKTTVVSAAPLNYQDGRGDWQPIEPTLVGTAGRLVAGGGAADVQLAEHLDGSSTLATVTLDADHSIGWGVSAARPVNAVVHGAEASYPGFAPAADLQVQVSAAAAKETIVLSSRQAASNYVFPLQLKGLHAQIAGGSVVLTDAAGSVRASIPAGSMSDAAGAFSAGVRYQLVGNELRVSLDRAWLDDPARTYPVRVDPTVNTTGAGSALTVRASGSSNGATTFDVGPSTAGYVSFDLSSLANTTVFGAQLSVVDQDAASCTPKPVSVYSVTSPWSATSSVSFPGPSYNTTALASQSFAYGYVPPLGATSTACPVKASLFNLGDQGRNLVQGWVKGQPNYGLTLRTNSSDPLSAKTFAGPSSANPPSLYVTYSDYNAGYAIPNPNPTPPVLLNQNGTVKVTVTNTSSMDWPASGFYLGYRMYDSKNRPATYANGAAIGLVHAAGLPATIVRGGKQTLTATIVTPGKAGVYTVDFTMVKSSTNLAFTDEQVPPGRIVLQIFNIPPVITAMYPQNGYQTPTLTPQLWAQGKDVDALTGSSLSYNYKLCPGTNMSGASCVSSGFSTSPGWVVPAGTLSWGKTYSWYGQVKDSATTTTSPTEVLLTAVPQPAIVGDLAGAPYSSQDKEFDPLAGNFSAAAIDATIATAGPDLSVARTYNSLDPRTSGMFGAGWTSSYDMTAVPELDGSGNVLVTESDGQQVRFGKNPDGTFTGPSDRKASLSLVAGNYVLKDASGSSFSFGTGGRIQQIQGPWGNPVSLTYDSNDKLNLATSGYSNRALTFTWNGNHVATVAAPAVNGVAPTWSYSYTGDYLTRVCDPDNSCTSYSLTADSHYRTAVLDAKPDSYWRLGESSGTDAGSEIAVNLGKDTATYVGSPTQSVAGALAGVGDTAVTLNGSTQYVSLPTGAAKKSRDMAVELWFKTTTAGPLVGYQEKALPSASANGVPMLYVGTDGKVHGQFRTGTIAALVSTKLVTDGGWHHVVLSAMGATQTLYVDDAAPVSMTGTINHATLTYAQLGAAYATGTWPAYPAGALHYFTGSIDEAAVYSHPLSPDVVAAHYALGGTAAEVISQVTLPSGNVASSVRYDPATDRVTEYTDRNGGSWIVGAPMVTGDDLDLRRSIAVTDPAGRPDLYEFDALTGALLRTGLPSGQTVRTEDKDCASVPTPADPQFCAVEGMPGASQVIDFSGMWTRSYSYNADGSLNTVTNENGDPTSMTYDAQGNVLTKKVCRTSSTDCHTSYYTYPTGLTDPLDPRWNKPLQTRDGRSASATDNTYLTSYSYDTKGDQLSQTSPDTGVVSTAYSTGTEPAFDAGTIPAGLPISSTDARNAVTRFSYYANGDLAQTTDPSGMIERFTYDALGRKLTDTEISDSYPSGTTTTFGYDAESRLASTTAAAVTDAVTGVQHQLRTVTTYDLDGNVTQVDVNDLLGGDATRTTAYSYDDHDRPSSVTDPNGNQTSWNYDEFGNKTSMTDTVGNQWNYAYTARNAIAEVRLRDPKSDGSSSYLVVNSYAYDPAGRLAFQTDAMGHRVRYEYYKDDLVHRKVQENFHNADGSTREYVLEDDTYDGAGNLSKQVAANGTSTTTYTRDAVGRVKGTVVGTGSLTRSTTFTYDLDGDATKVVAIGSPSNLPWFNPTQTQTTNFGYDAAGRATTESIDLGGGTTQTTTTNYDQRGLVTSVVDPRGNVTGANPSDYTTNYSYNQLGEQTVATMPPVAVEADGSAPATVRPQAVSGYDTFGETVESKAPNGSISTATFDKTGNVIGTALPSYTPPGSSTPIVPTTSTSYNGVGNVVSAVDQRGFTTRYGYDRLSDLITLDQPNSSDTDRAVSHFTYTWTGQRTSATDPSGAITQQTYDDLDRTLTSTQVERYPAPQNYTTTFSYDDNGNALTATSPSGAVTTSSYDGLGQLTQLTDANGVVTKFGYDGMGDRTRMTDGLNRSTKSAFDLGGRLTSESDLDSLLTTLRSQSYTYDVDGNMLTSTPGGSHSTSYSYNSAGQPTSQVDPVSSTKSITTSFGYDASGNRTRYTDGRGNNTVFTYNSWSLPQTVVEPATATQPAATDRTWTVAYDGAANPVTMTAPGGVVRQRTYDASDRLVSEAGSGAESATNTKLIGYDVLGRVTSLGAAGGTDSYTYDDRGLQLTAGGPSGSASFGYNSDGQLSERTDAAGTADYTYTNGRISAETDPVSGASQSIGYDASGAVQSVGYGAGRVRTFSYDSLGREQSDVLQNAGGATVSSVAYGYDLDNNVTSKSTAGVQGAGSNSYTYDYLGRLTSWTDPNNLTTSYAWDDSSNRTHNGAKTATYDERNRLLSDGTSTYTYTSRGSLRTKTTGSSTENFSFDAFDRLISDGGQSYSYDDLDRLNSDTGKDLKYAGMDPGVVSDGTSTYGRDADGQVMSEQTGTTKRSLIADQHGDVIGGFDPSDSTLSQLADSRSYDPWGNVTASGGSSTGVGYQGSWTDSSSGQVDMGARWYSPTSGEFASEDPLEYTGGASPLANKYTYANGNPVTDNDPDGRRGLCPVCSKVKNAVVSGYHGVVNTAKSVYNAVLDTASNVAASVKRLARAAWDDVKSAYNTVASAVKYVYNKAKSAVSTVVNAVSSAVSWVDDKVSQGVHWAEQKAQQAATAAYHAAVAVSSATKAAINYAVQHNPLPALAAAVKPLYQGVKKLVSAVASLPAAMVAVTVNVVKDAAASVQAVYQAAVTAAGDVVQAVSTAVQATATFVQDNWKSIAAIAAGALAFAGCEVFSLGIGTPGCVVLAGAVGGAVSNGLNCPPGHSIAACAAKGAIAGAIGGAIAVATGGTGGVLLAAVAAGGGAAAQDASLQYLNTGHVNAAEVAESAVTGAATGGIASKFGDGALSCANSFVGATPVLMADGSHKPIDQVHKGDQVLATDPETGVTSSESVVTPIVHSGPHAMVDVELSDGSSITATDQHPFWDETEHTFVYAKDLQVGDKVLTASTKHLFIKAIVIFTAVLTAFNLQISNIHTYYAGATPVLVHNACGPAKEIPGGSTSGETSGGRITPSVRAREIGSGEDVPVCGYCRQNPAEHVDHVIARSRGGDTSPENTIGACGRCNQSKGARVAPVNPPDGFTGEWPPTHWPQHMQDWWHSNYGDGR